MKKKLEQVILNKTIFRNSIIMIILLVLSFIFSYQSYLLSSEKVYDHNAFLLSLNNQVINTYYEEEIDKVTIPYVLFRTAKKSDWNTYQSENYVYEENSLEKMSLSLEELECYHVQYEFRVGCNLKQNPKTKTVKRNNVEELTIIRGVKTIYQGKWIEDVSKYMNQEGKYTIQLKIYNPENKVHTNLTGVILVRDTNEDI